MKKNPSQDRGCHPRGSGFGNAAFAGLLMSMLLAAGLAPAQSEQTVKIPSPLRAMKAEAVAAGTPLVLEPDAYARLAPHARLRLTGLPVSASTTVDLDLERFQITALETRIVVATDLGEQLLPAPEIALFRGVVVGQPQSKVVLGVSPRGMLGVIDAAEESYAFSPSATRGGNTARSHRLFNRAEIRTYQLANKQEASVADVAERFPVAEQAFAPPAPGSFYACRLALECDYEFWSRFNDYGAALDYIHILFGAISQIYERDVSTKLALTYIRIWTTPNDPYSYVGGDPTGLQEFQNYWRTNHNVGQPQFIERDVAHLLSSRGVGAWGNVGVLCNYNSGFSISGGIALEPTLALRLVHDIMYAGHEIGHNFNGLHTHCLINPATGDWIDKCATEPGCNQTVDCSTAPSSIMSYCDGCLGGAANVLQQFDAVNITRIRSHVTASCLRLARDPCYVDWRNTSGMEDGTLAHPYNTVKEGVEAVLPRGTVSIANGNYPPPVTLWQPMRVTATGGTAVIGR